MAQTHDRSDSPPCDSITDGADTVISVGADTVTEVDVRAATTPEVAMSIVEQAEPDRVSVGLRLLVDGLVPYVELRLKKVHGDNWESAARKSFRDRRSHLDTIQWDAHTVLTVMWDQWNAAFRQELGHAERSYVSELRDARNRWAHQQKLDFNDTYRVLDSIRRLLTAVDAPTLAAVERLQKELLESHVGEQVNSELQSAAFDRNKLWTIGLYVACCLVIMIQLVVSPLDGVSGTAITGLVLLVLLVFLYLIYQQFKLEPALLFGPHECPKCRKIIYRKNCPYCK